MLSRAALRARHAVPLRCKSSMAAEAPLHGTRVLELEGLAAAPLCGMLLADFGADVVRVDKRGSTGHFATTSLGRGKRSVALDLKDARDKESFMRLVGLADVLIEPYRPMVMERLGLGPNVLLDRNPALVYARLTGWGQDGPQALAAGHDINYIAQSGALGADFHIKIFGFVIQSGRGPKYQYIKI